MLKLGCARLARTSSAVKQSDHSFDSTLAARLSVAAVPLACQHSSVVALAAAASSAPDSMARLHCMQSTVLPEYKYVGGGVVTVITLCVHMVRSECITLLVSRIITRRPENDDSVLLARASKSGPCACPG